MNSVVSTPLEAMKDFLIFMNSENTLVRWGNFFQSEHLRRAHYEVYKFEIIFVHL